jgi:hypothetical protein
MTRLLGILGIASLSLSSAAPAADRVPQSRPLSAEDFVVAGVGVVDGMNSAAVRRVLGRPHSVKTVDDFRDPGSKLVSWRYKNVVVLLGAEDSVHGVLVTNPTLATARGLRVGDRLARMEMLYGAPDFRDSTMAEYADPDQRTHVVRILFTAGVVKKIFVGWILD